jgi:hypothetical protein
MMNPEKCRKLHATLDAVQDMMKTVKEDLVELCGEWINDTEAPGDPEKEAPLNESKSYTERYLD